MIRYSRIISVVLGMLVTAGTGHSSFGQSLVGLESAPAEVRGGAGDDVSTLDGIIKAYYEVVSGPAGEVPDYKRDASLHHPDALISVASFSEGKPRLSIMSLKGFYERFGGPRQSGFYEWEIHRKTERFGNIANVWSTYVTSDKPNGKPRTRGINNIQLFYDGQRWWITSWIYDNEREGNPIPEEYLPKN